MQKMRVGRPILCSQDRNVCMFVGNCFKQHGKEAAGKDWWAEWCPGGLVVEAWML